MTKPPAPPRIFSDHHPCTGVFFLPDRDRWQCMVRRKLSKKVTLTFQKRFYDYVDAVLVRDAAARLIHGDKAKLNYPRHQLPAHIPESLVSEWLDLCGFREEHLAPPKKTR